MTLEEAKEKYPLYSGIISHNFQDLSGKQFGELTVLYRTENTVNSSGRTRTTYCCQCSCGNIIIRTRDNLLKQTSKKKSCQHCFEHKVFDNFNVLECYQDVNDARAHYKLSCKKCGYIITPRCYEVQKNKICPKCSFTRFRVGDRSGSLIISEIKCDEKNCIKYFCYCDCGENITLSPSQFAHQRSCGKCKINDIIGQRFGNLTVIEATQEHKGRNRLYKCLCDCGNTCIKQRNNLLTGHTSSCGCLLSKGEEKINYLLNLNNIQYIQQATFDTCLITKNNNFSKAKFDFYINNQYLIEYDGEQHFHAKKTGWATPENFEKTQQRDKIKNQWCKDNNIPLIRIPYTHYDDLCIEDLMLENTKFRVV